MSALTAPDPLGDSSMLGRLYLLLKAVLREGFATTDDAILRGEQTGRRLGNPKLLGIAASYAHRRGWIRPMTATEEAGFLSRKSGRKFRACGLVQVWTATEKTRAAFEMLKRRLTIVPSAKSLFDEVD